MLKKALLIITIVLCSNVNAASSLECLTSENSDKIDLTEESFSEKYYFEMILGYGAAMGFSMAYVAGKILGSFEEKNTVALKSGSFFVATVSSLMFSIALIKHYFKRYNFDGTFNDFYKKKIIEKAKSE